MLNETRLRKRQLTEPLPIVLVLLVSGNRNCDVSFALREWLQIFAIVTGFTIAAVPTDGFDNWQLGRLRVDFSMVPLKLSACLKDASPLCRDMRLFPACLSVNWSLTSEIQNVWMSVYISISLCGRHDVIKLLLIRRSQGYSKAARDEYAAVRLRLGRPRRPSGRNNKGKTTSLRVQAEAKVTACTHVNNR